jgi:hypothetical protein
VAGFEKQSLHFHVVDESVRNKLEQELQRLEDSLKIEGLAITLFQAVMELVGNAIKANIKRIFFQKLNIDINNPAEYHRGIDLFSDAYPSINKAEYEEAMRQLDLEVCLEIDLDQKRLLIFVENNTIMVPQEEERIRSKLAGAMDVKDVVEFFQAYGDDTEGRGLGLAMIIFLIKDLGFSPEHFRVFKEDNRTIARMEFPLDATYKPIRHRP